MGHNKQGCKGRENRDWLQDSGLACPRNKNVLRCQGMIQATAWMQVLGTGKSETPIKREDGMGGYLRS